MVYFFYKNNETKETLQKESLPISKKLALLWKECVTIHKNFIHYVQERIEGSSIINAFEKKLFYGIAFLKEKNFFPKRCTYCFFKEKKCSSTFCLKECMQKLHNIKMQVVSLKNEIAEKFKEMVSKK